MPLPPAPLIKKIQKKKRTTATKETRASVKRTAGSHFIQKGGVTFLGAIPILPSRITSISEISWSDKRKLQLLRHLCIHVLDYSNRNGLSAVEIQAIWLESHEKIYLTANVGAVIDRFETDAITNIRFFFEKVGEILKDKKPNPQTSLARQNSKVKRVKAGTRTFPENQFVDLGGAMLTDGRIAYIQHGQPTTGPEPVVLVKHSYSKDSGNVRHAEQILIKHILDIGGTGKVFVAGTKIPCFTCSAEFVQWSKTVDLQYVHMAGALFKNTINTHFPADGRLKILRDALVSDTSLVNNISEVQSDSDCDDDYY